MLRELTLRTAIAARGLPVPEKTRRLHQTLETLHAEIEGAELDEALRSELRRTADEIERALSECGDESPSLPSGLGGRLRTMLEEFERAHPRLTWATGRVVDALAEMGL